MPDKRDPNDPFEIPKDSDLWVEVDTTDYGPTIIELEQYLKTRIKGQNRAVAQVARTLALSEAGMLESGEPAGILFWAGPPGVGKTQLAHEVARKWIGIDFVRDEKGNEIAPLTKIDCTKLTEPHSISELLGSDKNYVGYKDPIPFWQEKLDAPHIQKLLKDYEPRFSNLTAQYSKQLKDVEAKERQGLGKEMRERLVNWYGAQYEKIMDEIYGTHSPLKKVVLFDEIDRAHSNVWGIIMTIANKQPIDLKDGERKANFANGLIIMTSNIGQNKIQQTIAEAHGKIQMGFGSEEIRVLAPEEEDLLDDKIYDVVRKEIERIFPAPFVSRIRNSIVVFRPLSTATFRMIVDQQLADIQNAFKGGQIVGKKSFKWNFDIEFTPVFREFILKEGVDPQFGARPLEDKIKEHVKAHLANGVNSGYLQPGDKICFTIHLVNGKKRVILRKKWF